MSLIDTIKAAAGARGPGKAQAAPPADGDCPEKEIEDDTTTDTTDSADEEGDKAAASPLTAAFALMKSPDAKGREALAQELAEDVATGKMTAGRAAALLAAAPKGGGSLAAAMGERANPKLGSGAKTDADSGDSLIALAKRNAEARRAGRR